MAALTPVDLQRDTLLALHAAHPERYPVLLQSAAQGGPLGRFDILLACPGERLTLSADRGLQTDAKIKLGDSFLTSLDRWWAAERTEMNRSNLPFVGGWFLYLGYELAREIEPKLVLPTAGLMACAIRIPAALVVCHDDSAAWIADESEGGVCSEQIRADLASLPKVQPTDHLGFQNELIEEPESRYLDAVSKALEYIRAGDIYQANLSRLWQVTVDGTTSAHAVYRRLRRSNPAPFAALAQLDNIEIVSSSPERLVEVRNGMVATRPIAGTRPRRSDRSDDELRLRELHSHPKERAEHVMLIDLERNDLGRICEPGTVEVDQFMALESYAHVHHIVSNVRGRMRADVSPGQVIAAVFPGGTITGCPKIRCMQVIAELERESRGAYTGSLGYLNRDGTMDLNILIRTIEIRDRVLRFRAGAGIVSDSIPERELEETRAKARGMIEALRGSV